MSGKIDAFVSALAIATFGFLRTFWLLLSRPSIVMEIAKRTPDSYKCMSNHAYLMLNCCLLGIFLDVAQSSSGWSLQSIETHVVLSLTELIGRSLFAFLMITAIAQVLACGITRSFRGRRRMHVSVIVRGVCTIAGFQISFFLMGQLIIASFFGIGFFIGTHDVLSVICTTLMMLVPFCSLLSGAIPLYRLFRETCPCSVRRHACCGTCAASVGVSLILFYSVILAKSDFSSQSHDVDVQFVRAFFDERNIEVTIRLENTGRNAVRIDTADEMTLSFRHESFAERIEIEARAKGPILPHSIIELAPLQYRYIDTIARPSDSQMQKIKACQGAEAKLLYADPGQWAGVYETRWKSIEFSE